MVTFMLPYFSQSNNYFFIISAKILDSKSGNLKYELSFPYKECFFSCLAVGKY